ncbi:MAG: esterase family protein [Lentisphaeria bacterium]|nr:esterase family protein [Lentisphaeria bacterium]
MAFFQCSIFSESLGMTTNVNVFLPQFTSSQIGWTEKDMGTRPALYLLHGLSEDFSVWIRHTNIERYAAQYGLVLVMPDGGKSFYADTKYDLKYEEYIAKELPSLMAKFFRFSTAREDTFIAGNSMGGYGALKIALKYPETFSACGAFSPVPDPMKLYSLYPDVGKVLTQVFGSIDDFRSSGNDVYLLAEKRLAEKNFPKLYLTCGKGDFLNRENRRFQQFLEEENADFVAELDDPGDHEWDFWDRKIRQFIRFLPIRKSHVQG